MTTRILSAALAACLAVAGASAHAAGGTVWASEVTQILNNVQLGLQYGRQVQMVLNQLKELEHWKTQLQQLSGAQLTNVLRSQFGVSSMAEFDAMFRDSQQLAGVLKELRQDMVVINYEQGAAATVIDRMRARGHQSGVDDYAAAMFALSKEQQENYGDRYQRFSKSLDSARNNITRAQRLIDQAPALEGTVEGLQALNAGSAQMQVQLAEIAATMAATGELAVMEASREEVQRHRNESRSDGEIRAFIRALERKP